MQDANFEPDVPIPLPILSLSLQIVEATVRGGKTIQSLQMTKAAASRDD